jgi:DNA-binding NtrC family response regulator
MRQDNLLLLDFNPSQSYGGQLQNILETSFTVQTPFRGDFKTFDDRGLTREFPELLRGRAPILLVLPPDFSDTCGQLLQALGATAGPPVIVLAEVGEPGEMFRLLEHGVADFITPPFEAFDVLPRVWRVLERDSPAENWAQKLKEKLGLKQLVGGSPSFLSEVEKLPLIARCDASVLISGETGTGKEVCARAIHYLSPRAGRPFVPVNCGAIPLDLIENELFGHERGAYTGASSAQQGLIEEANGGTLFLDEIDSLPPLAQVKLLRFLQEKEFRPLGSTKMCKADVRVVAASNSDFDSAVREGRLRRDLYYRLNVMPLSLPPLRERREDIRLLAQHFLEKYVAEFDKEVRGFLPQALRKLQLYEWPGNVRELENVVERAVMLCACGQIGGAEIVLPVSDAEEAAESFQSAKAKVVAEFEKSYIQQLLLTHQGNITKAAQTARKNRRAFWQLIRKYRIDVQRFKPCAS